jgi:uncharacterized membrane protein
MAVGPIQVVVFGFDRTDQFRGEVLDELASLRGRGLIRLIDLYVALKSPQGDIVAAETSDLSADESAEFGQVLGKLLGVEGLTGRDVAQAAMQRTLAAATASLGMDFQSLRKVVEDLQPGRAFAVLMFEHTWAIPLAAAIRRAGGVPLAQGFVTPEALVMVGEELNAIAEAAAALEFAEIVKGAAILDTLATLREAEAIKTAIAADVLRTLAVAEVIEEAAVGEAIGTLATAGLLEARYLDAAVQAEAQEAEELEQFFTDDGSAPSQEPAED